MESLAAWAEEDGHEIEPHGLDLIDSLAALARRRLPHWSDRISVGNVMSWKPPLRFDFVCTSFEYVPPGRRRDMIGRLLDEYLLPDGRLILTSYGGSRRPGPKTEPVAELLRGWDYEVVGESLARDTNGTIITRVAWIDAPG